MMMKTTASATTTMMLMMMMLDINNSSCPKSKFYNQWYQSAIAFTYNIGSFFHPFRLHRLFSSTCSFSYTVPVLFSNLFVNCLWNTCTIKPVYKDHLMEAVKVTFMCRRSLYTGSNNKNKETTGVNFYWTLKNQVALI